VFILPQLTKNQPSESIDEGLSIPSTVVLADPEFGQPESIDLLLGAEVYSRLIRPGLIELGDDKPTPLICDLTKYLVAIPIQNKSAKTVAKALFEDFILKYGPMKTFITDMGTEYKNSIIEDLCKNLNIKNISSTAHHHQTVGTVERSHRTFNAFIRSYISVDKTDWDNTLYGT